MAITEEQVFSAAEEIRDAGKFPSAISVREITKTGSLGTIQKHLRKWRHRETVSAATSNPPPEDVLEALKAFGDSFWRLALQHSDKAALQKVRLARDEQDEARRDMEEALEKLEQHQVDHEKLSQKIDELLEREQSLNQELSLEKDLVQKASLQCHKLEETIKSIDERYRELESRERDQQVQLNQLKEESTELANEKEELSQRLGQSERLTQEKEENLNELSEELKREQELSNVQQKETSQLREQLRSESAKLNQALGEKDAIAGKLEDEQQRCSSLERELRDAQVQLESTKIINERLEALLERLNPAKDQ